MLSRIRLLGRAAAAVLAWGVLVTPLSSAAQSDGSGGDARGWPREIERPGVTVVMYEPQIVRFTMDDIEARAAVQVTLKGKEPIFGAVWIAARVETDRDTRLVTFTNIRVPKVRFEEASDEEQAKLAALLEREMPSWEIEIALDRLIPLLEVAEHDHPREAAFKNDPPEIVVSTEPATLVVFDGAPRRQVVSQPKDAAKRKVERVVNTPVLLVFDPREKSYFLAGGGDLWYAAHDALGPYAATTKVPNYVREMAPKQEKESDDKEGAEEAPPKIIVATKPTELIVAGNELDYAPLGDVDLLAVTNADRDILVTMKSREHYVLLSGRWYASTNALDGPWRFVPPSELPEAFGQIPEDSEHAHVRAHVPGTVEAKEALLDNTIPQTTAVQRDDTSLKVEYDGAPQFEDVEGVKVQYAVNTPQSVFKVGSRYYACEQGVWYESSSATGPWKVATKVPEQLYDIPPSNPHHNVTYVRVYDVTPKVVYVGYTPGYVGSYVYRGCVVYGTGWRYPGWYGHVYYPRPATWGFGATYSPWYGWGFGISWSSGPLTVSVGFGGRAYSSWWGPWGWRPYYPPYRPPYYPGYRPPYYPGYRPPHYPGYRPPHHPPPGHRPPGHRPPTATPRPGSPAQLPAAAGRHPTSNIYTRQGNAGRNAPRPVRTPTATPRPTTRPNNVYSDRNGNVYRSGQGGSWDRRQGGTWQKPTQQPSAGSLNRDRGARQRGQTRTRSAPRPSGRAAPRGGGRRR